MNVAQSHHTSDSASPDTTVWNTAAFWGTGPKAESKDFLYSCNYTLFQIILETMEDKGAQLQAQLVLRAVL